VFCLGCGSEMNLIESKFRNTVFAQPTESEDKAVSRIDDLLDSFLGIRDRELGKLQRNSVYYLKGSH